MFSFLHVADIHLDSPLHGLSRYEGAPVDEIRGATRQALANLVDYAVDNAVPLVVLAGDVYDADCPDYQTLLHFAEQMSRLGGHGIQVIMIRGNHDADNPMTASLRLPENVHVLSSTKADTWRSPDLPVAVHGRSYAGREILDNLAATYPAPLPDLFNIGLLHTAMTGRAGHARYAPCSLNDLTAKGYQYWALGHVHDHEIVHRDPHVVYSGCIQGRHIREAGAKGCVRVDVHPDGTVQTERVILDVLRWMLLDLDLTGARDLDDLRLAVTSGLRDALAARQDDRMTAVRLRLYGQTPLHAQAVRDPDRLVAQIRLTATDVSRRGVWVEKVILDTTPDVNIEDIAEGDTPQAALLQALKDLEEDPAGLDDFKADLRDLTAKLVTTDVEAPDLDDPRIRAALIRDARDLLLPMLTTISASPSRPDVPHAH
ncbi:DNA repair exonuclease [Desulfonatronum sp. SC1]|uniref:metallophosphoesterase family protein n=1 Tax=Desulfonatronum sp. SC1 TaxID=2109626 RepID=UPI000D301F4F|nr:DNA repair exonuclease [Desulfonatronum sp. SC1]PTN34365.1 DNA repair exonuclease [Desulfonatronum sp. SC1]